MKQTIALILLVVYIDMYTDKFDSSKTNVVIDRDGDVQTFSVKTSEINDAFVKKVLRAYGEEETDPVLSRKQAVETVRRDSGK